MRAQIRNRIIAVINRNCYWLQVVPEEEARTILCTGLLQELAFNPNDVVVRVTRNHNRYRKGKIFTIPASAISETVARLSSDRNFAVRASQGTLTVPDVEKILVSATNGAMVPDLFDY